MCIRDSIIVICAIFIGNIAYETGNLVGGSLGVSTVFPSISTKIWAPLLGILAFILLWSGSYKAIEKVLIALVLLMSLVFISTAIVASPDWGAILKGLFTPKVPKGSWLSVVEMCIRDRYYSILKILSVLEFCSPDTDPHCFLL